MNNIDVDIKNISNKQRRLFFIKSLILKKEKLEKLEFISEKHYKKIPSKDIKTFIKIYNLELEQNKDFKKFNYKEFKKCILILSIKNLKDIENFKMNICNY